MIDLKKLPPGVSLLIDQEVDTINVDNAVDSLTDENIQGGKMKFVLKSWVKIFLYAVIVLTIVITLMLYILNYYNFGIVVFEIFFIYMLIKTSRSYYLLENDKLVEHGFKNLNYDISSILDVKKKIVYNTETHSSKNFAPMRVDVIITNSESIKVSNLYVNQSGNTLIEYLKQTKLSNIN